MLKSKTGEGLLSHKRLETYAVYECHRSFLISWWNSCVRLFYHDSTCFPSLFSVHGPLPELFPDAALTEWHVTKLFSLSGEIQQ